MIKKCAIIALSIAVLLVFNFIVRPHMHQRDAVKAVETVLTHWENNNITLAMTFWEKEIDSPPIYGLISHEIENKEIGKKDGKYAARISAKLIFSSDNLMPSGKIWIFKLKKTRYGWKIADFRLAEGGLPQ